MSALPEGELKDALSRGENPWIPRPHGHGESFPHSPSRGLFPGEKVTINGQIL